MKCTTFRLLEFPSKHSENFEVEWSLNGELCNYAIVIARGMSLTEPLWLHGANQGHILRICDRSVVLSPGFVSNWKYLQKSIHILNMNICSIWSCNIEKIFKFQYAINEKRDNPQITTTIFGFHWFSILSIINWIFVDNFNAIHLSIDNLYLISLLQQIEFEWILHVEVHSVFKNLHNLLVVIETPTDFHIHSIQFVY